MLATFASARNVYRRIISAIARVYTTGCNKEPACQPQEPSCNKAFSACDEVNDDPCNPQPKCCGSERLGKDPCFQRRSQSKKRNGKSNGNEIPTKSVWEYPADCCGNPCPELLPRFDTLYYEISDKAKRCYQQTWLNCKPITFMKVKCSCQESDDLLPIYRREKVRCPDTACEYDAGKMKELCCLSLPTQCARTTMPCCRPARVPPKCVNTRGPSNCEKRCCPYPAYSECCHPCIPPLIFRECRCMRFRHTCEAYAALRRKKMYGLPPNLPEWPPKLVGPRI